MIEIYYGMSGTFKGTTINSRYVWDDVMWSAAKPWKKFHSIVVGDPDSDLNLATLHLVLLEKFTKENHIKGAVERGITDMLFYYTVLRGNKLPSSKIQELIEEENKLLKDIEIKRILLLQKDHDFIRDCVLKNKYRREVFGDDVDSYLKEQKLYSDFTQEHNKIDEIIEIPDAKYYIENVLGKSWDNNNL